MSLFSLYSKACVSWADFWKENDFRLNDPEWLSQKYVIERLTEEQIAEIIGCSPGLVHTKLEDNGALFPDSFFGIHTGYFHIIKRYIIPIMSPYILKIQKAINIYYEKTLSRNSKIFKQIISEIEEEDKDYGASTADELGFTRKTFYIFCLKFMVILYEFDTHYAERGDGFLKKILEHKDEFYLDEQADPKNWYPYRDPKIFGRYLILRNRDPKK